MSKEESQVCSPAPSNLAPPLESEKQEGMTIDHENPIILTVCLISFHFLIVIVVLFGV